MFCDKCGSQLEENQTFCPNCGNKISMDYKCKICGSTLNENDVFCTVCGNRIDDNAEFEHEEKVVEDDFSIRKKNVENKHSNNILKILLIVLAITAVLSIIGVFVTFSMINNKGNNSNERQVNGYVNSSSTPQQITPQQTQKPMLMPTPTVYPTPVFSRIDVSSTRGVDKTEGINNYYKEYAIDGKNETAWSPEKSNIDPMPWIQLSSDTPQYVTGIRVANGYFKSQRIYENNKIITKFLVEYDGGEKTYSCGIDQYGIMQDIRLDTPALTSYVRVTILDTHPGKQWNDIAISEISVY